MPNIYPSEKPAQMPDNSSKEPSLPVLWPLRGNQRLHPRSLALEALPCTHCLPTAVLYPASLPHGRGLDCPQCPRLGLYQLGVL